MRLIISIALIVFITNCASKTDQITLNAHNGANGHSLVSQYAETSELECGEAGGTRLDVFMDLDDSLSATSGDLYQNSLVACNGSNGSNGLSGQPGEPGPAGEVGPQGLVGLTGAVGPQGLPGLAGPTGPQGSPGLDGSSGSSGSSNDSRLLFPQKDQKESP